MFFFYRCGDHRELPVLTHSFPTRRSSDLAPETATLQVTAPYGTAETRTLTVDRREYRIQRIDGIAKEYVSPPEAVLARIRADAEAAAAADRKSTRLNSSH